MFIRFELPAIIIFMMIMLFSPFTSSPDSERKIFAVSSSEGILVSENDGRSWSRFNKGLPGNTSAIRFYSGGKEIYLATFSSGIFRLEDEKWINISSDKFMRRSIYSKNPGYRKISAFAVDPDNGESLVLATKHTIYRSPDKGKTWLEVPMKGLNGRNYITALAVTGKKIYAGTSFNGVFESSGRSFKSSGNGLPGEPYSGTMKFTEQVSYLFTDKKTLYAGFEFGGGLYKKSINSGKFSSVKKADNRSLDSIIYDIKSINGKVYFSDWKKVETAAGLIDDFLNEYNRTAEKISKRKDILSAIITDKKNRIPALSLWINNPVIKSADKTASEKKAIYLSVPALRKNLNRYLKIAAESEIDTFVIDMKDDFGNVYFPTENRVAAEIRAIRRPVNLKSIIEKLKAGGIYSIARIVTFKDQKMFNAYKGKYAIKNIRTGRSWIGAEGEYWVDPYSVFVQNYNINLARELEKAGFDEIQFDYIRFPSDGPVHLCKFSFQNDKETYKSEILIDFLKKAKQSLTIAVSVDIYGFNSWYHFGNMIGQDIEDLSHTVDVICPMVYPSHFGSRYYKKYNRYERPYRIVRDGGIRSMKMVNREVLLRPYIQGFNLMSPAWGPDYIIDQVKGAVDSGCSGYTIWNAKGDYNVPYKALKGKK